MVPENDVAGLKEKMLYLLDHDDVRAQFSKHAREDILKEASIEGMFQNFQRAVAFVRRQPEPTASPTSNMAKDVIS
jgi:glycosyltransferase involved in cell wall biosynthesis